MNNKHINELVDIMVTLRDRSIALAFLQNILTPAELDEIALRLQIVKLLKKGIPQREVAKQLGASIGTVSRGARELKYGKPGFKQVLK